MVRRGGMGEVGRIAATPHSCFFFFFWYVFQVALDVQGAAPTLDGQGKGPGEAAALV